ncbi:MAG: energy-coupling factor ABC transporter ATP-binding protein [Candidatus Zipacnadales bacterium]
MNAIEIERLSYTYPDGSSGLREVSLAVAEGQCAGLVGPNGAGKSTLLLHLNGILEGDGSVRIYGRPVRENLREARRLVGLVFQNPDDQLFMPTVFDDVAFGPLNLGWDKDRVRTEVARALDAVGLTGYDHRSPHHLSLGEKKRVSLATVLVMDCRIMVLDEPTSGLDPRGRGEFIDLVGSLDKTKIIATHDLDLVRELCNTVIVLDEGRIVAQGPTDQMLSDKRLLAEHRLMRL